MDPATQAKLQDGFYGLGGVSFRGDAGAHTEFTLKERDHTRLEVRLPAHTGRRHR